MTSKLCNSDRIDFNFIKIDLRTCFLKLENYCKTFRSYFDDTSPNNSKNSSQEDINVIDDKKADAKKGKENDFFLSLSSDMIFEIISRLYNHVHYLFNEYSSLITHEEILSVSDTNFYNMKISFVQRTTLKKLPDFLLLQEFVK